MTRKKLISLILLFDAIILIAGLMNFALFVNKAGLPAVYYRTIDDFSFTPQSGTVNERIVEFDGIKINQDKEVDFRLLKYMAGNKVKIKSIDKTGNLSEREILLPPKYSIVDLTVMMSVALFYYFTGIWILIRYREAAFSFIVHFLTLSVGSMIIFEWGDIVTYSNLINFIFFWLFEAGIYLSPLLFLHFSFVYPVRSRESHLMFLAPFYYATTTFIIIATIHLIKIFFMNTDVSDIYFMTFHTTVADVYLAIVLILTIAKLEHSALTLTHAHYKKQIYWALLGIMFGPLIYIFLFLIPRILLGYELVSAAFMQFTFVIAPITLLISITRKRKHH